MSVAPLLALFIIVLARIMRPRQETGGYENDTPMDRALAWGGRWLSFLLDLIFLPFEWIINGIGALLRTTFPASTSGQSRLKRAQRERMGTSARILLLSPMLIFVLSPFLLDRDHIL